MYFRSVCRTVTYDSMAGAKRAVVGTEQGRSATSDLSQTKKVPMRETTSPPKLVHLDYHRANVS